MQNIFKKYLNKKEGFSDEDKPTPLSLSVFLTVLMIVSLTFDILKHTPVYENNVMKHILNTNYVLSYGFGSLLKVLLFHSSVIKLLIPSEDIIDYTSTSNFQVVLSKINTGIILSILLTSLFFDIIMLTPLMKNKYINNIASFNSCITFGISILMKIQLLSFTEIPYLGLSSFMLPYFLIGN